MIPQPQYRWFDLIGESEVRQVDVALWASDGSGTWTPITLQPGAVASVKLLFAHKCITDKRAIDRGGCEDEEGGRLPKKARYDDYLS